MNTDHIRLREQLVQRDIFADGAARVVGVGVVDENAHAERFGDGTGMTADLAAAAQTEGFTLQFNEGIVPVAPIGVRGPFAGVDRFAVRAHVMAHLQQKGDGKLADGGRAVDRDVYHRNTLFASIVDVYNVEARGKYGDELQVGAAIDGLAGDGRLVHHHDIRTLHPLGDERAFLVGCAVIDSEVAKLPQRVPTEIARVFRIAVQNDDFHAYIPPSMFCCAHSCIS